MKCADLDMSIGAVVVTYESSSTIKQCLASMDAEESITSLVVVDNASTDGSWELVPKEVLIRNQINVGFSCAVNQGVRVLPTDVDSILLLNPDAWLMPGAVAQLQGALQSDRWAAAAGPNTVNEGGSELPPTAWKFPSIWRSVLMDLHLTGGLPIALRRRMFASFALARHGPPVAVDWLFGSCLLVRREMWEPPLGGLDEDFFLFGEELDLFWRASKLGWHCLYVPEAKAVHLEGHSAKKSLSHEEYDEMRMDGTAKACRRNMSNLHFRSWMSWQAHRRRRTSRIRAKEMTSR